MNSNFERFPEILNQANSENFSCLSHVEPKNLPRCPKPGAKCMNIWKLQVKNFKIKNLFNICKIDTLESDKKNCTNEPLKNAIQVL